MSFIQIPFAVLQQLANEQGFNIWGISPAAAKPKESERLKLWQDRGNAGDMNYMQRDANLQSDPQRLLPGAKTVISLAFAYDTRPRPKLIPGYGRVARYAWGRDYHLVLPQKLLGFVESIKQSYAEFKYRIFSDAVPFLERAFAASAGLGFIGKNTLLIRPKLGSFTLLAEILCDFEVIEVPAQDIRSSCGSCRNCLDSCPTNAFESEYVLDSRKCISYLSIEKKGVLAHHERTMLGEWIFGCDVCQEVCPFNHGTIKKELEPSLQEFSPSFGVGPMLKLEEIIQIKDSAQYNLRFKSSPLLRTKRERLIRNAICVAVNTKTLDLISQIKNLICSDPSELVRQFALWGFIKLSKEEKGRLSASDLSIVSGALEDHSPQVAVEAKFLLSEAFQGET